MSSVPVNQNTAEQLEDVDHIFDSLEAPEIDVAWKQTANEIEATPELRREAIAWVRNHRNFFVQSLRSVTDPADLRFTIALRYIELKSVWMQFNTTINYSLMSKGEVEPRAMLCSALISQLLVSVEALLTAEEYSKIEEFLANPLSQN
jgi:hypothetical protein